MAKGAARDFLTGATVSESLDESLLGCISAVGFSRFSAGARRNNIRRHAAPLPLGQVARLGSNPQLGKVALVFGSEDMGLQNEHLALCSHICQLPTSETMPSLNLSHAVAIGKYFPLLLSHRRKLL